jgi:hypothetical protein
VRGTIGKREHLLWQTGQNGDANDSYATLLQGDGNLIVFKKAVSDGKKTTVWKSSSVNSLGKYYLVLACEAKGSGLAIYNSLPGQGGYPVWIKDTIPPSVVAINAPAPATPPPPTFKPFQPPPTPRPVSAAVPLPTLSTGAVACNPRIFLERYQQVSFTGPSIIFNDAYLTQRFNGNVQVRSNIPNSRGKVIWERPITLLCFKEIVI